MIAPVILSADYLVEARQTDSLPPEGEIEIAIAGRSNVGKSTLLNRLAGRRALARTSKTPGRTRGVMFYELGVRLPDRDLKLRLVDLPGYGYAQVSKEERLTWRKLVEGYVTGRTTLRLFLVLVDARREIQDEEQQLVEWLVSLKIPYAVVVTKTDKVPTAQRSALAKRVVRALGDTPPLVLPVSGETGEGVDRLWETIFRAAGST